MTRQLPNGKLAHGGKQALEHLHTGLDRILSQRNMARGIRDDPDLVEDYWRSAEDEIARLRRYIESVLRPLLERREKYNGDAPDVATEIERLWAAVEDLRMRD